jgi:hypothetical protein
LKTGIERVSVSLTPVPHRVGEHDADPGRDHRVVHNPEDPCPGFAGLGLQDLVDALLVHAPF